MKTTQKIKRIVLGVLAVFLLTATTAVVLNVPEVQAATCGGVEIRIDVGCKDGESAIFAYTKAIIRFLSGIIGIAVIGAIIFFGIMYGTSNGDSGQTKKAVEGIRDSIIGAGDSGVVSKPCTYGSDM